MTASARHEDRRITLDEPDRYYGENHLTKLSVWWGDSAQNRSATGLSRNELQDIVDAAARQYGVRPQDDRPAPEPCRNCGSTDLTWAAFPQNLSNVPDGRLSMREVAISAVLSCETCSETIDIRPIDKMRMEPNP